MAARKAQPLVAATPFVCEVDGVEQFVHAATFTSRTAPSSRAVRSCSSRTRSTFSVKVCRRSWAATLDQIFVLGL